MLYTHMQWPKKNKNWCKNKNMNTKKQKAQGKNLCFCAELIFNLGRHKGGKDGFFNKWIKKIGFSMLKNGVRHLPHSRY